ncbi:MAG: CoA pyrophosphatase [Sphingomicrobium sp.]
MSNLFDRVRAALDGDCTVPLAGDDFEFPEDGPLTPAAVLVALTDSDQPGMILTVRRADLRTHAGQVAFPGGRIDEGEDGIAAALREAEEEIGLPRAAVRVAGVIADYRTITDYRVTPVIAVVPPGLDLAPHEAEVAALFEVPLDVVLDPARQHRRSTLFRGRMRHYYEIEWDGHRIWGATASIIVNLTARLQWR